MNMLIVKLQFQLTWYNLAETGAEYTAGPPVRTIITNEAERQVKIGQNCHKTHILTEHLS